MPNNQHTNPTPGRYRYHRDRDGCDDVFLIEDADGHCILRLHFWDEPDTIEGTVAEAKARMLVAALNLEGGGWVQIPYVSHILADQRQIADIWAIEDVQELRPDLTDDQAWEVLRHVRHHHSRERGITRDTVRAAAREVFPESGPRTRKRPRGKHTRKPSPR
jgi:hypothetical protein